MKTEIAQRLTVLRGLMAKAGVNAAIINKTDPHQSEYIGAHWAFASHQRLYRQCRHHGSHCG